MISKIYILRNESQEMQSFLKVYIQIFVDPLTFYLLEMKRIHTTKKHEINDRGIPREFVVKEALRGISEETRFVVTRSS